MASNQGPAAIGGGLPATSVYHKEHDTGFNSWNNNNPSAGGGGATLATAGVPGGSTSSHMGTTTSPAAGPSGPQMDLMKRIWFCNYVHWVV